MSFSWQQYRDFLFKYLKPYSLQVLLLAVLLFAGIGLQLVNPQVIRYFIDTAQSRGSERTLLLAALLYISISLVERGVALWSSYVAENLGWEATNSLRQDLALHLLRLDLSFHKQRTPGELIERVDGDVTGLANFFSRFTIRVVANFLLVIGILVLLFRESWLLGIGLAVYVLIILAFLSFIQRLAVTRWAAARQAWAEQFGFLEERISGAEDIRASGAEDYVMNRLYRLMRAVLERLRSAYLVGNLVSNFTSLLFAFGYAFGLVLGVILYTRGQATIGTAYLIVYYVGMLSDPLQNIRSELQDLQQATASLGRIQELMNLQPQVEAFAPGSQGAAQLQPGALSVSFESVSFGYDGGDAVLKDVSFNLPSGKVLGVLGRTGSGKTTLTRLLFRLYDPTQGAIHLENADISKVPLQDLRDHVGMVTQDVQLFQASVRDNLAFFNQSIPDGEIQHAIQELSLNDWMDGLPGGLDAQLSAGGQNLSAGEAQLLAFARVFLKNPGLLILDEASSRLDPATENLLELAIDRLFAGRTGIIIAHRLRTVQRADDILILEDGRIVEAGPRAVLAADPSSHFYRLLQTGLEEALA